MVRRRKRRYTKIYANGGGVNLQSFANTSLGSPNTQNLLAAIATAKNTQINQDTPNAPTDSEAITQGIVDNSKLLPGFGPIASVGDAAADVTGAAIRDDNMGWGFSSPGAGEGALTGAMSRGAAGASIGATFGGVGAPVGAAIGATYGAIEGAIGAKKRRKAAREARDKFVQNMVDEQTDSGREFYNQIGTKRTLTPYARRGLKLTRAMMNNNKKYYQEGGAIPAGVGGKPQGPNHEQGGLPVVNPETGEPVAEMEGNERIFSQEDTMIMEEMAVGVMQAIDAGDQQSAMQAAAQLGMAVVDMLVGQEEANQEAPEEEMEIVDPSQTDMTYMEQPI